MPRSRSKSLGPGHHLLAWLALVLLGALSFGLSFVSLGAWSLAIALAIASVKALLVVLVFMHLSEHHGSVRLWAAAGVGFVALLVGLMTFDVTTRP